MVDLKIILNTFILNTYFFGGKRLYMDVSKNNGTPKSSICSQGFPLFSPSILGYPYFWKHPYFETGFFSIEIKEFLFKRLLSIVTGHISVAHLGIKNIVPEMKVRKEAQH